jgi:hypothetical protein
MVRTLELGDFCVRNPSGQYFVELLLASKAKDCSWLRVPVDLMVAVSARSSHAMWMPESSRSTPHSTPTGISPLLKAGVQRLPVPGHVAERTHDGG